MKKKIITILLAVGLIAVSTVPSFAKISEIYETVPLGTGKRWSRVDRIETCSGKFSYVVAGLETVHQINEPDSITQVYVRVCNTDNEVISRAEYVTLKEGTGMHAIPLREGYFSKTSVAFEFKGTTDDMASAIVKYHAR